MAGVNKVILIGNLGKDPEIHNWADGLKKVTFSLATSETYKNKEGQKVEQTEWHNIVLWRKNAEIAEQFLKKGMSIYIEGKIKTRSWEDKEGNKRHTTEIIGDNFTMLGKKENTTTKESSSTEEANINTNGMSINTTESADDLPF